jgi:hypothetical protein
VSDDEFVELLLWSDAYINLLSRLTDEYLSNPHPATLHALRRSYNYLDDLLTRRGVKTERTPVYVG